VLYEPSLDIDKRIKYIKTSKPKDEVETRLRLLKPVKNPTPEMMAWDKADKAWVKAFKVWDKAFKAFKARDKADKARDKARVMADKAAAEAEALHKVECPGCPWNGKTIFSEKKLKP
jgi:hypothetical protein